MSRRYHYILDIELAESGRKMKLKLRQGSKSEDIVKAIRSRFSLGDSVPLVLVDSEGCDVVIDDTLETGSYTLHTTSDSRSRSRASGRSLAVFVDQTKHSRAAFLNALERAKQGDSITLLHCVELLPEKDDSFALANKVRVSAGEEVLNAFLKEGKEAGKNVSGKIIAEAGVSAREAATGYVNSHKFDVVFTGTRGLVNGVQPVGSFSYYLVQHANTAVMVIKNTHKVGKKFIVFVYGGKECRAAFLASLQRKKENDELIIAYCVQSSHSDQKAISEGQAIVDKFVAEAKKAGHIRGVSGRVLASDSSDVKTIAAGFANQGGVDAVFVGTRGLDESLLLTSFSHHLLQAVKKSDVVVVRDPELSLGHIYA